MGRNLLLLLTRSELQTNSFGSSYGRDAVKVDSVLRRILRDEMFFSHVPDGAGRLSFNF